MYSGLLWNFIAAMLDFGSQYSLVSKETFLIGVRMVLKLLVAAAWSIVFIIFYRCIPICNFRCSILESRRRQYPPFCGAAHFCINGSRKFVARLPLPTWIPILQTGNWSNYIPIEDRWKFNWTKTKNSGNAGLLEKIQWLGLEECSYEV